MILEIVTGPVAVVQVGIAPLGGVIEKAIPPVGWLAPTVALPVMVALKIVAPPKVGLGEATKEIPGAWEFKVIVSGFESPAL